MTNSTWFGDSTLDERFPAWTRGNAADVFPEPFSPLGLSMVIRNGMCTGLRNAYISIGALDYDEFVDPQHPDLFKVFGGYPYNPLTLTRIFGARMPGASPEAIDKAFFDDRDDVPPYEYQSWHNSPKHEARLGASAGWAMSADSLPELDVDKDLARTARLTRPDFALLNDAAVIGRARMMIPLIEQTFENAMRVSTMASIGPGVLGAVCEALGDASLAIQLLAGIEVDSAEPAKAMWNLGRAARESAAVSAAFDAGPDAVLDALRVTDEPEAAEFLTRFEAFLVDHGSRGPNEYDPRSSSWEVRPRIALAAIDLMRRSDESQSPSVRHDVSVANRDAILMDLRAKLAGDAETAATFEAGLKSAQLFLAGRERAKTNVVRVINEVRIALRELGRRLTERGVMSDPEHIFMLTDAELDQIRFEPEAFAPVIAQRWTQYRALFDYEPVFIVNGRVPALDEMTARGAKNLAKAISGTVLTGAASSGGVATGRARIVLDAADPMALEPGDVLVAPQTDPAWVPLFVPACAVVVNVGAMGSHAMIVSRELGIPCVASVADATELIADGAMITVDGNTGTVTIH
jgi:rifampicin phosphotransferase